MPDSVLITLPDYEDTVFYLSKWIEKIIDCLQNLKFLRLEKDKVNRKDFESYAEKTKPNFIILNGHGSESTVCGRNGEPIFDENTSSNIIKDKLIYARACSSAAVLGKECVKKGAKMYAGYSAPFIFYVDSNYISRPLSDPLAAPVLEWSNATAIALLNKEPKQEINEKSKLHFKKIERHLKTHYSPETEGILACLRWNMMAQEIIEQQRD